MPSINLKQLKALKTKKGRDKQGLFIIEGEKAVAEIPEDWNICAYVCTEGSVMTARLTRAPVITVSNSRFLSLSDTVTPQGIMAVCEKRTFTLDNMLDKNPFLLIGERLSDPGNIGTLIRTAAAAGASGVILSAGSGDLYNPKVIRAAAGAALRIPVMEKADLNEVIPILKQQDITVLAAHLSGAALPYVLDLRRGCAILIGNEAGGLSEAIGSLADIRVKLPLARDVESLNASVAGGILLYEVVRQRLEKNPL